MLSKSVLDVIKPEMERAGEANPIELVRRKGDQEEHIEDIYTRIQVLRGSEDQREVKGPAYDILPEDEIRRELLKCWTEFHSHFSFSKFAEFYSKRNFCTLLCESDENITRFMSQDEDHFILLLADRKFLFLEDNEHGNNPEYPPLSEIVHNPKRYLITTQMPKDPSATPIANAKMCENAKTVWEQGFVPTHAHEWAYNEMKRNEEEIRAALEERKELIQHSRHFLCDGVADFPTFTIPILTPEEEPAPIDHMLSQLFHDFLYSAAHRAYVKKYDKLIDSAQKNSLNAIMCVRRYVEGNSDISVSKSLIFWWLFTKETTKLAQGELKSFKFKMPEVKTGRRLTRETQAPSYRKIECQIMLFDYLLKLLPPTGKNKEQEIAHAKFQFHMFSKYNGYTHFRVKDIKHPISDHENKYEFDFSLVPDSKDSIDSLGGVIRKHILRCISNDVRWLTPGLPNNWNINSSILATLLLQDVSKFPKSHRLMNRIYAFLKDTKKSYVQTYNKFNGTQSELIDLLNKWCIDNDLIFEDDIPSSDMEISDDKMKLLCSRLVLEYVLKEQALLEAREGLSAVAQKLWGHLLLTDYETFYLDEGT